ncbi:hypothetical protein ACFPK9_01085 [Rubritalea spongiae]|uniref:Integrase n=1 Tax=Rubritalea spongiae TaxID=430797 RepID=A0ABW5E3I9_9BACT
MHSISTLTPLERKYRMARSKRVSTRTRTLYRDGDFHTFHVAYLAGIPINNSQGNIYHTTKEQALETARRVRRQLREELNIN